MGTNLKTASEPQQARAKQTYDKLLSAAQHILETEGLDALNSNAIAKQAGLTPPAFYRYFADKYAVLGVLCERLMDQQNSMELPRAGDGELSYKKVVSNVQGVLEHSVKVAREFEGGRALLYALRTIPELRSIRLKSQAKMATYIGEIYPDWDNKSVREDFVVRARLALDIGYGMLEMLFDTNFEHEDIIISRTAHAAAAVFGDVLEQKIQKAKPQ